MIGTQDKARKASEMFSHLRLDIDIIGTGEGLSIDNLTRPASFGILSERQIAKVLRRLGTSEDRIGWLAGQIAEWTFSQMKGWRNIDFTDEPWGGDYFERDMVIRPEGLKVTLFDNSPWNVEPF